MKMKKRSVKYRKVVRTHGYKTHYNMGRIGVLLLGILIVLASIVCLVIYALDSSDGKENSSGNSSVSQTSTVSEDTGSSQSESKPVSDNQSSAAESSSSVPSENETPVVQEPEAPPVSADFNNALFIGDSRTKGFMLYSGVSEATYFTSTGLNVSTAMTKPIVDAGDGTQITIPQALRKGQYSKVYVMLGVNELGWTYSNIFIEKYQALLNEIKATQPGAKIYVQSILPVSAQKSASDPIVNNTKINEYNTLIQQMCSSLGVTYLNSAESVADAQGNLPAEATTDGVHLNQAYCIKWRDYLKAHS